MKRSKYGLLVVIGVLLGKLGGKLSSIFFKLLKSAKVVKVGLAGASMVSYAYIFSWQFALMLMTMLFVHEYGHVWAMKKRGMKVKGMYFIPFLGAAAVPEDSFDTHETEVYTALMGPIWGLVITAAIGFIYYLTENPLYAAGAAWLATINLFNLLPIMPLDGGRVLKCVVLSVFSIPGLVIFYAIIIGLILGTHFMGLGLFAIIFVLGAMEVLGDVLYNRRIHSHIENLERLLRLPGDMIYDGMKVLFIKEKANMVERETFMRWIVFTTKKGATTIESGKINVVIETFEIYRPFISERIQECRDKLKKKMPKKSVLISIAGYLLLAGILFYMIDVLSNVPGADLARDLLK